MATIAVRIIVTGGTFDKEYDELKGRLFFKKTHVPDMLALARCGGKMPLTTLMMIDSLDMTIADRKRIASACKKAREERIVITHGTDTMVETAKLLAGEVKGKTIVLTGAMVPYRFGSSDGMFNLGTAIAFAKTLPPGVYIAMNGCCFDHGNVRKNRKLGLFEKIS